MLVAVLIAMGFLAAASSVASAETRTLKLYFIHTKEKAAITFKRNGRYDQSGLKQINRFLRDWRRNEPTNMDPRLLDLIWEAYQASGSRDYIHVVSAYRSPATNSMLRSRSKGVANKSQHMLGKAMDFYLPDVRLKKLREIGLKLQAGGVGYYPRSGSPFVHFDVGNVRHWPRMSRKELVAVFPRGKTLHVPSDGKPLPGFEQAVAAYQARKNSGHLAVALAGSGSSSSKKSGGLLAALFGGGGGADEEEDSSPVLAAAPAPKATVKQVAKQAAPAAEPEPGIQILSPEEAQRADIPQVAEEPEQTPETIIAALPARSVPLPVLAPRPQAEVASATVAAAVADEPENVPFGMAQGPLPEGASPEEANQVALNIPLPTRRPDYTPPQELATPGEQDAILLALADPQAEKPTMADVASLPMPESRPETLDPDMVVAALPDTPSAVPAARQPEHLTKAAAVQAEMKASSERVAALASSTATPREAVVQRAPGSDPVAAMGSGVKTTRKTARASADDSKPDRKPVVVAAQPQAARWVLHTDYVKNASAGTKAPSFAYNLVRTAPREVYTAGFQAGNQMADANRFSGKAVEFLSVARF